MACCRTGETYEIMKPEDIGLATDGIVLGKHSGRHALAARAKALGYVLEGEQLDRAFAAFKAVADEVGIVDTARLVALLSEAQDAAAAGRCGSCPRSTSARRFRPTPGRLRGSSSSMASAAG